MEINISAVAKAVLKAIEEKECSASGDIPVINDAFSLSPEKQSSVPNKGR